MLALICLTRNFSNFFLIHIVIISSCWWKEESLPILAELVVQRGRWWIFFSVTGTKFLCSEVIALIRSEVDEICLQIINFEDLSSQPSPQPAIPPPSQTNNRLVTRCKFQSLFFFVLSLSLSLSPFHPDPCFSFSTLIHPLPENLTLVNFTSNLHSRVVGLRSLYDSRPPPPLPVYYETFWELIPGSTLYHVPLKGTLCTFI